MSYIGNPIVSTDFPVDYFSGNGSTTAFTLSIAPASVNAVDVEVSGVSQSPQTYTVSGTTLTFSAAPPSGTNNIVIKHRGVAGTPNVPSAASVGLTQLSATGTASSSTFLRGDNTWAAAGFPSGTAMLFVQTSAPTGWTKSTTHNDKALRIVSGTASSGGTTAFTTAFASGLSAGATTLSTSQIPSHQHTIAAYTDNATQGPRPRATNNTSVNGTPTTDPCGSTGGGSSHTHSLPAFDVQYVDVIIATKD